MIYCQACNDKRDGIKGSPLTEHTCKGMETPFMPNWASRPGNTINNILTERKMGVDQLAKMMQIDLSLLLRLLVGAVPITESIAEKLSAVLGSSVDIWLNRQKQYEESLERITKT